MKCLRLYFYFIALAAGLAGCYADFDLKVKNPVSRLVVHSFVTSDSLVVAEVSHSWIAGQKPAPAALAGARAALSVNGEFKEWLQWRISSSPYDSLLGRGLYYSTIRPREGDRVELKVEADGFHPAQAEDRIPEKAGIETIRVALAGGTSGYKQLKMYITFQDKPGRRDYYGLKAYRTFYREEGDGEMSIYSTEEVILDYSEEPLFSRTGTIFDDLFASETYVYGLLYPFSDEGIDGERYTLKVSSPVGSELDPLDGATLRYTVCLYAFSEDYYRYILSLTRQGATSLSDYGLADPALLYHNVTGGIGLVGTYRIDSSTFDPQALLETADL